MEQLNKFSQSYALKIRSIKHKCIFRLKKLGKDLIDLFAEIEGFSHFSILRKTSCLIPFENSRILSKHLPSSLLHLLEIRSRAYVSPVMMYFPVSPVAPPKITTFDLETKQKDRKSEFVDSILP